MLHRETRTKTSSLRRNKDIAGTADLEVVNWDSSWNRFACVFDDVVYLGSGVPQK